MDNNSPVESIRPLGGHVLVELDEAPEGSNKIGRIMLPRSVQLSHCRQRCAKVVAVGPGYVDRETNELVKPTWKPGDHVMLNKHGGYPTQPADPKCRHYIVSLADILGEV